MRFGNQAATSIELSPRQYAQEIASLSTLESRRAALSVVPEHLRAMVQTHLTIRYEWKKYHERQAENRQPAGSGTPMDEDGCPGVE